MELKTFLTDLFLETSKLNFVKDVEIHTEIFLTKGKLFLNDESFLKFYFNSKTRVLSFAWIKNNKRIWGLDFDSIKGWHIHSIQEVDVHFSIEEQSISEIIKEFSKVYLTNKN